MSGSIGIQYTISGDKAVVSGVDEGFETNVIIADTYEGVPVTEINVNVFVRSNIETITFGSNITKIYASICQNCNSLTEVDMSPATGLTQLSSTLR